MTEQHALEAIDELLSECCDNPAQELIRMGEVMVAIGKELQPLPPDRALAVLEAVAVLKGVRLSSSRHADTSGVRGTKTDATGR